MKLRYFKIECNNDSDCYSIRTRTKKDAMRKLISQLFSNPDTECLERDLTTPSGIKYNFDYAQSNRNNECEGDWDNPYSWGFTLKTLELEYSDGFDLMDGLINGEDSLEYGAEVNEVTYTLKALWDVRKSYGFTEGGIV
jgi:hypothetical protein